VFLTRIFVNLKRESEIRNNTHKYYSKKIFNLNKEVDELRKRREGKTQGGEA
jgi:hypothetical protein